MDKPDLTRIGMKEKVFTRSLDRQRDELSYIGNYVMAEYVTKLPDRTEAIRVCLIGLMSGRGSTQQCYLPSLISDS